MHDAGEASPRVRPSLPRVLHLRGAKDEPREHEEPRHPGEPPVAHVPYQTQEQRGSFGDIPSLAGWHVHRLAPSIEVAQDNMEGCQVSG